jgi:type IV secretory pathway VirJ component
MKRACVLLVLVPVLLLAADESVSVSLRGKAQSMPHLRPPGGAVDVTVIFLPGDGGWRGEAVSMAKTIASWGYEVYGFDTKKYLEAFSQDGAKLSRDQLAGDMRRLTEQVGVISKKLVILVGWSQGAGMAVAAVSGVQAQSPIHGVITLGLPESAVLGWDWKATLAIIARREPDQPTFSVKQLLGNLAPTPIWMIHGSEDEYTTPETARKLFQAVSAPKQLREIGGANHRFDGHQDELYRSLKEGLEWIATR